LILRCKIILHKKYGISQNPRIYGLFYRVKFRANP
jgi:hypothetical protein